MKRAWWQLRQWVRGMGLPGWIGAVMVLACAALWLGVVEPQAREAHQLADDAQQLEQRLAATPTSAATAATPKQQLETFTRRFSGEKAITPALGRLHAIAKERGVRIEQAEFRLVSEPAEPLARYTIVLPAKADYRALRLFSRDVMRELPELAIEEVSLRRGDAKQPVLESQLRMVLFVNKAG